MSDENSPSATRRQLFKGLALAPMVAAGITACAKGSDKPTPPSPAADYAPSFFNAAEWRLLLAACDRLIPTDDVGPGALQAGVPEFIDRHMQTPYASGDIWYMQGPFLEAAPTFGYQGRLPLRDILRVGMKALDAHCEKSFSGKLFAQLDHADQEQILQSAEAGQVQLQDISAKEFFNQLLAETRMGYFCDPKYGGNKNMAGWKMIGYPGVRADYTDWVEVRNQPYPLPPVDLSGQRG